MAALLANRGGFGSRIRMPVRSFSDVTAAVDTVFGPTVDHVYEIQTIEGNLKDNSCTYIQYTHVHAAQPNRDLFT